MKATAAAADAASTPSSATSTTVPCWPAKPSPPAPGPARPGPKRASAAGSMTFREQIIELFDQQNEIVVTATSVSVVTSRAVDQ